VSSFLFPTLATSTLLSTNIILNNLFLDIFNVSYSLHWEAMLHTQTSHMYAQKTREYIKLGTLRT
jgi:hypothetical protein